MKSTLPLALSIALASTLAGCSKTDSTEVTEAAPEPPTETVVAAEPAVSNPFFEQSPLYMQYPQFDKIEIAHYVPAFDKGMEEQLAEIQAIVDQSEAPTFDNTLVPLEKSGRTLARVARVFFSMTSAHTNDDLEAIRTDMAPRLAAHNDQILLNGEPVFLRGISLHEEAPFGGGRAHSEEHAKTLLGWAQELGCNFVRLAHYPHAEVMTRLADEMGLLVWSEIPVYWDVAFDNPETLATALRMQEENIMRDRNRASIMFWSVANETPQTDERLAFLDKMATGARTLDGTRLITAALHNVRSEGGVSVVDDPLADSPIFHEGQPHDDRYAVIKRPVVFVGGELTLELLELPCATYSRV